MGLIVSGITKLEYRTSEDEQWTVIFDHTLHYAIQKSWEQLPEALIPAYLYSFVFIS